MFPSVFNMSVGSSPEGSSPATILTKVAGAFIYVGIMMTLVTKIFSLIHVLPDQILRWVGGSQDFFGKGMEHEATGGAKQAVGSVSSAAAQGYATHRISGKEGDPGMEQIANARRQSLTNEYYATHPNGKLDEANKWVNDRMALIAPERQEDAKQTGGTSGQQSGSSAPPSGRNSDTAQTPSNDKPVQVQKSEHPKGNEP